MATAMATSSIVATAPCPSSSSSAPACSLRSALPLAVRFSSCASLRSGGSLRIQFVGSRGVAERRRGAVTCSLKKLAEVESVELTEDVASSFPAAPGIYAVYDKVGDLQYIGLSRRISASLQTHSRDLPELCASAKVCGAVVRGSLWWFVFGFVLRIFFPGSNFALSSLLNVKLLLPGVVC